MNFALCAERNRLAFAARHFAPLSFVAVTLQASGRHCLDGLELRCWSCWSYSFLLLKLCFHGKRRPGPSSSSCPCSDYRGSWLEKPLTLKDLVALSLGLLKHHNLCGRAASCSQQPCQQNEKKKKSQVEFVRLQKNSVVRHEPI